MALCYDIRILTFIPQPFHTIDYPNGCCNTLTCPCSLVLLYFVTASMNPHNIDTFLNMSEIFTRFSPYHLLSVSYFNVYLCNVTFIKLHCTRDNESVMLHLQRQIYCHPMQHINCWLKEKKFWKHCFQRSYYLDMETYLSHLYIKYHSQKKLPIRMGEVALLRTQQLT